MTAIRESRGLVTHAARMLRCERATVRNYCSRYPDVQAALDEERERLCDSAEFALIDLLEQRGDARAIPFVLRTIGSAGAVGAEKQQALARLEQAAQHLNEVTKTPERD